MIKEEETPPPSMAAGGVVGGVPGGVPGGQMGGVIGGIIGSTIGGHTHYDRWGYGHYHGNPAGAKTKALTGQSYDHAVAGG